MRDSSVRGTAIGRAISAEKAAWRKTAAIFLKACALEAENEKAKDLLPKEMDRLSSFYLAHACDKQLQGQGWTYKRFFESETPAYVAIERRPLLVENMDSGSINACKTLYLLRQKNARLLPFWDLLQKR